VSQQKPLSPDQRSNVRSGALGTSLPKGVCAATKGEANCLAASKGAWSTTRYGIGDLDEASSAAVRANGAGSSPFRPCRTTAAGTARASYRGSSMGCRGRHRTLYRQPCQGWKKRFAEMRV